MAHTMDALARIKANRLLASLKKSDCEPCTAASPADVPIHGLAALYDVWSSDGGELRRRITAGALRWDLDEEGIPLVVEHDGGVTQVVGRLDSAGNTAVGMEVTGRLFAPEGEDPAFDRLVNLIEENSIGWSIMMSEEQGNLRMLPQEIEENSDGSMEVPLEVMQELTITSARVRHLAFVDVPAFPGARPVLGEVPVAAAAAVADYPSAHFDMWESRDLVPFQTTADGRVWGHAAGEGCFRVGSKDAACQKYEADPDPAMKNFHTGTVNLDNGKTIRVGVLTCANLHADIFLNAQQQRQHHENTSIVWAKVIAWNDSRGRLCISGSVVPGIDKKVLAQVAGQPLSVELWPVPGVPGRTLVGAHSVNTPAWPVE